jgi:hypothetical protein
VPKSHEKDATPTDSNGSPPSHRADGDAPPRKGPEVVAPSSRVNVAFPFSQIKVTEPSKELAELAGLVYDLVEAMDPWLPEDQQEELRGRARALRERLH